MEIFCSVAADDAAYLLSTAKGLYELNLETRQVTPSASSHASPECERIPAELLRFHAIARDEPVSGLAAKGRLPHPTCFLTRETRSMASMS